MPRMARNAPGGLVYHVLNRANGRLRLFKKDEDFLAFERVLQLAHDRFPIRILDWCLMPNHWHFVLWPEKDGELTEFTRWLTLTPRAEQWRWGSCHVRGDRSHALRGLLNPWPVSRPSNWLARVNLPQSEAEEKMILESIARSRPVGGEAWTRRIVRALGLEHTIRPRGRPMGWRKRAETAV